jgi:PIN domain
MAFDNAPPIVLLDANLLYPFHLRNLLIQFGVEHLVDVRWTDAIHEEWIGNLVADGRATRARLMRTLAIMRRVLPEADVRGYEHRIAGLSLPDAQDRHVLAAAIEASASVLLTFNLADFPPANLAPHGVVARAPDDFLCELHTTDPEAVEAVVDAARHNLRITTPQMGEFIDILERQRLVSFAACLRK